MNPWLQAVLGVCGVVIAVSTIVYQSGRGRGEDTGAFKRLDEKWDDHELEIRSLREWRHTVGNQQQNVMASEEMFREIRRRLDRVESKVFNGDPRK